MDAKLALTVGSALAQRFQGTFVSAELVESPMPSAASEAGSRQADLILLTPQRRDLTEIVWYPHTTSWALLRLHTPLLFWPANLAPATLLTARHPTVVVPLDGHKHAERAIPLACSLAEVFGGEVVLTHVVPMALSSKLLGALASTIRRTRLARVHEIVSYLRHLQSETAERTTAPVTTKILLGEPGTALVRLAKRQRIGAIVMTTHSRARNERFFAGAVATQIVRQSPAPTLLLPLGAETETSPSFYHAPAIPVTP
jgi:nucleotide-binding universal stress UspA family protein